MTRAVLTVRLSAAMLDHLDALSRERGRTRSQVVLDALAGEIERDTQARQERLAAARARLQAPLQAQARFLETASIADEWRAF